MKRKRPAEVVDVCDICERESSSLFLEKCKACGKEYCVTCRAIISGCVHTVDVCMKCSHREEVRIIAKKYAPRIQRILDKRDEELEELKNDNP